MPPSGTRRRPGPLLSLLLIVVVLTSVRWLSRESPVAEASGGGAGDCPPELQACEEVASPYREVPSLPREEICPGAGYLCAGLGEMGVWRVMRWNDDTPVIRVRVPTPPEDDRGLAMALQQAAARGIRAWDGHPFPLRVDLTDRPGPADFMVAWVRHPTGAELGHARTEWKRAGGRAELRVSEFTLSFRSPFDATRPLSPREVQLSAAHEMGHALGLPHSDEPGDVMYPTNTALHLSARDYRTMEAFYRLPNGATITR